MAKITDEPCASLFVAQGAPPAFSRPTVNTDVERWFAEHESAVRAVLGAILRRTEDVDDCWQATLLVATVQLPKVAPGARRAWLIHVARNKALELLRRRNTGDKVLANIAADLSGQTSVGDDPAEQLVHAEKLSALRQLIQALPQAQQTIVELKIHQGLTFQEIADRLGIPLGTALTRMRLAMEKLTEGMRDYR